MVRSASAMTTYVRAIAGAVVVKAAEEGETAAVEVPNSTNVDAATP